MSVEKYSGLISVEEILNLLITGKDNYTDAKRLANLWNEEHPKMAFEEITLSKYIGKNLLPVMVGPYLSIYNPKSPKIKYKVDLEQCKKAYFKPLRSEQFKKK